MAEQRNIGQEARIIIVASSILRRSAHVHCDDRAWRELGNHRNPATQRAYSEAARPRGPAWLLHGNLSPERAGGGRHTGPVRARQSFALIARGAARLALPTPEPAGQAVPRSAR